MVTGQSADLAPADGKLYALRDVTGTVQSIPLIASSIMSKKIAAGAQAIVLDVKVGQGAFMRDLEEARLLAETMTRIAELAGRKAVALLSDMNQPLGCAVGNALELREAVETLRGGGPADFRQHCLVVAGHMLALAGKAPDAQAGQALAEKALANGSAYETFRRLVLAQGGDVRCVDDPELLPQAALVVQISAPQSGWVSNLNARTVGETVVDLGGGRLRKEDKIDYAVGVEVHHKVGDYVEAGKPLFTLHAQDKHSLVIAKASMLTAYTWSETPVPPLPLFYK